MSGILFILAGLIVLMQIETGVVNTLAVSKGVKKRGTVFSFYPLYFAAALAIVAVLI